MHSGGGDGEQHIPVLHPMGPKNGVFFDDSGCESRHIKVPVGIQSGHLRSLASRKRAARKLAALLDTLQQTDQLVLIERAASVIIEKENEAWRPRRAGH